MRGVQQDLQAEAALQEAHQRVPAEADGLRW